MNKQLVEQEFLADNAPFEEGNNLKINLTAAERKERIAMTGKSFLTLFASLREFL